MAFLNNIYTNVQNWHLFITTLAIALTGSFHMGYQILLADPSEATFIAFMNSSMEVLHPSDATIKNLWGFIIALLFIGSIVGSFFIRLTVELIGSRYGIILSGMISLIALGLSIASKFANSIVLYSIARFIIGISTAICVGIAAIFLTECSPASSRGFVNMMSGTILQLGTVFGSIIAMPEVFGSLNRWWLIYAFEMIPLFISIVWMIFVYESPIQYLHKDDQENAKKSIMFYHGKSAAANRLNEILLELNQQKSKAQQNKANFLAIFKSRENLRGCLVGCIVATTVGFSGVTIIGVYWVEILTTSGFTQLQSSIATTLIMITSVIVAFLSSSIVDIFGRRSLMLVSNGGVLIVNLLIGILMLLLDYFHQSPIFGWILFVCGIFQIVFFVVGVLPISFFVTVEMVQPEFRSSAQMIATLVQMITRSIGMVVYVPLAGLLANWISYLILFFIPLFLAEIVFYFMLPETKGKDFDGVQKEISRLPLIKRIVKRKSRSDDNEINSESNDNKT